MSDTFSDATRHAATDRDQPRQHFILSLDDVMARFDAAAMPRTMRTLQRYCVSGRLDCLKTETPTGEAYVVDPQSVDRAIGELKLIYADRPTATRRDVSAHGVHAVEPNQASGTSRPTATDHEQTSEHSRDRQSTTANDMSRAVATELDIYEHPYVKRLENQIEKLETRYEAQIRRTEELQLASQKNLADLQRMTTIGQSKTLAEFMLQAKNWLVGTEAVDNSDTANEPAAPQQPGV